MGVYHGELISFAFAGPPGHRMVVAWTGLLRDGRMETMWHVTRSEQLVAEKEGAPAFRKKLGVWESTTTGADTFERIGRDNLRRLTDTVICCVKLRPSSLDVLFLPTPRRTVQ